MINVTSRIQDWTFPLRSFFSHRRVDNDVQTCQLINRALGCNPHEGCSPSTVQPWCRLLRQCVVATAVAVSRIGSDRFGSGSATASPASMKAERSGRRSSGNFHHVANNGSAEWCNGDASWCYSCHSSRSTLYPQSFAHPNRTRRAIHKVAIATLQFTSLHTHARNASWSTLVRLICMLPVTVSKTRIN